MTDAAGRLEYINRRWTEYSGLAFEESLGEGWRTAIHPDDVAPAREQWSAAVAEGVPEYAARRRFRRFDGAYRWFLARAIPMRAAGGHIVRWFGTSTDIDDEIRSQGRRELLAQAGFALAEPFDFETTLRGITRMAVGVLADLCIVDLREDDRLKRVAIDTGDLDVDAGVFGELTPPLHAHGHPIVKALESGETQLADPIDDRWIEQTTWEAQPRAAMERIGLQSMLNVPIASRGERFGVLTLGMHVSSGRRFGHGDVRDAEELGRRAGIAIANARLIRDLVASEARYRQIIETAQEGVWILDAEGRTRYVNHHLSEMLGYAPDEMFGRPATEFFEASQRDAGLRSESGQREYRLRHKKRHDVWTLAAVNPILDPEGRVTGTLAMVTDITGRKQMEVALAHAAADYRSLAEATPQIVWTADPAGAFDYVNARWTEYTGLSRADALGAGWTAALHPEELLDVLETWRCALESGDDVEATYRLRRASDGAYRWHLIRATALRDADGPVLRWFGTCSDIHDERRIAHQLDIIARTSAVLTDTLDRDAMLERLAALVVEQLAQWVHIDLYDDDGRLVTIGTAHRRPDAAATLRTLRGRRMLLPEIEASHGTRLAHAETRVASIDVEQLVAMTRPEHRDAVRAAGAGSYVCAPLRARGRTTGAIVAYAPPDQPFTADDAVSFTEIAARAAVAFDNAGLYAREHRVAATLQQALLPTQLPAIPGLELDAIYQPGTSEALIGGDWYDAYQLADGRVAVSIGDVTGRGLRAAVIMGRVRQAIEALTTYQSDPAQLLNAADAVLRRRDPDAIVTALVGVIDTTRHTFAYATAGHPTPFVRGGDGNVITLPGHGLPLGLRDAHQPPTSTIVLPPDAMLLLYTDGLVESTHDIDEGERRVIAALGDPSLLASPTPAAAIKEAVLYDGSRDDVAVFTVRIGTPAEAPAPASRDSALRTDWSMHWTFDARDPRSARDVRDLFVGYLRAKGRDDADYHGAELVFGELIGNVARHASGVAEVEIEWRGDAPVLHVLDRGPGYDHNDALPAFYSESGRGLYLVNAFTREFTVTRLPGYGTHVRAVLAIERQSSSGELP